MARVVWEMDPAQHYAIAQDLYLTSVDAWLELHRDTDSSAAERRAPWVAVDILRGAVDRAGKRWTGRRFSRRCGRR